MGQWWAYLLGSFPYTARAHIPRTGTTLPTPYLPAHPPYLPGRACTHTTYTTDSTSTGKLRVLNTLARRVCEHVAASRAAPAAACPSWDGMPGRAPARGARRFAVSAYARIPTATSFAVLQRCGGNCRRAGGLRTRRPPSFRADHSRGGRGILLHYSGQLPVPRTHLLPHCHYTAHTFPHLHHAYLLPPPAGKTATP